MAGRRTFRILTYSQLSGIKVKAAIRPKYNNLYIVMIQRTHYKNYYTFKASNENTHKTKQYTQIQLNLQLVIKIIELNCKKLLMKPTVLGAASGHSVSSKFCQSDLIGGMAKLRFFLFTASICSNTRVSKCKQKYLFRRCTAPILCCVLTIW